MDRFKFKEEFEQDPQKTLEYNGVYLPEDMSIEFQKPNSDRPRIVVYEQRPNSKFRLRVLISTVDNDGGKVKQLILILFHLFLLKEFSLADNLNIRKIIFK